MHIIINARYDYYISNNALLEEGNKEENLAVLGLLLLPPRKED
jgi:hypothetical protein